MASSAWSTSRATASRGHPQVARPEAQLTLDRAREELVVGVLEDEADLPGQAMDGFLRDVAAIELHRTRQRPQEADEVLDQGRLAGAVLADDGDPLTRRDRQRDAAHRLDGAVAMDEPGDLDGR